MFADFFFFMHYFVICWYQSFSAKNKNGFNIHGKSIPIQIILALSSTISVLLHRESIT